MPACRYTLFIGQTYFVQDPFRASPGGRLLGIEPPSRQVKTLAYFDTYVVSPDERWIVGEAGAQDGADGSKLIAAFSPTSHACRVVARATSPNQYLSVQRSGWEFVQSPRAALTFKDPVAWHNVVQDGTKLQVVTGPGPGFTRDSQNVIVAEYQWKTKEIGIGVTHRRLVKFNLSSLHTPCPASVAPPG